jgi:preprotein translocase subunit Sec61beta
MNKFYDELNEEIENGNRFPKWITFITFAVMLILILAAKMGAFRGW